MQLKALASKIGKGAATKQIYIYETWLRWAARGIQLIFALVVIGLYGSRVDSDRRHDNVQSSAWVYAVVVAGFSAVTCVLYSIPNPFPQSHRLFAWDLVLFILWIACFGTFAQKFLHNDEEKYEGISVSMMRHAVWIDLVNALFWLGTGAYGFIRTFVARKANAKIDQHLDSLENKVAGKINTKLNSFKTETV